MECQKCRYWERTPSTDDDVISENNLWHWNKRKRICSICGFTDEYDDLIEHIVTSHKKELDKLRDTRIGQCSNKHFIYTNPKGKTPDAEKSLFYCDSEEYGAFFYTGQSFGCKYFKRIKNG